MPLKPRPIPERFKEKIRRNPETGCIEWIGTMNSNGYGQMWVNGRYDGAHRLAWELERGPIPEGLHIDHLCRNPRCVNPEHLEPVTPGENNRRGYTFARVNLAKTHCPEGHDLTGDNLDSYALGRGHRACRECMKRRCREWHARNREARLQTMRQYKARKKAAAQ